jgi:hypothetical protein
MGTGCTHNVLMVDAARCAAAFAADDERDLTNIELQLLNTAHFALATNGSEADLMRGFLA